MSLEKEKLQFEWQKATNNFMIYLSLLIALASFIFISPLQFRLYLFWLLIVVLVLMGISMIVMNMKEYNYGHYTLRDKRKKEMDLKARIIRLIYMIPILIGIAIIYFGIVIALFMSGII